MTGTSEVALEVSVEELGPGIAPDRAQEVVRIVHAAFGARPTLDPPSTALEETVESVAAAVARGGGLIARVGDRPVAALLLEPDADAVLLRRVSVLPDAQGHGVAQALAAAAERWATERGLSRSRVVARAELPGTVRFWLRLGYAEVHRDAPHLHLAKALPVELEVATTEAMHALGRQVGAVLRAGDLLLLTGDLGAGKTTLTQGIGAGLGVRGGVTSPTFVISRVHPSLRGGPALVHVDAYRLGGLAELDDLDLDVSVEDSVTVVEWGEGLAEALSEDRLEVTITRATGEGDSEGRGEGDSEGRGEGGGEGRGEGRRVRMTPVGPRWAATGLPRTAAGGGEAFGPVA